MIAIIIFLFIVVSAIIVIQISYNEMIFQQLGKVKWLKFLPLAGAVIVLMLAGIMQIPKVIQLPLIKFIDNFINNILLKVAEYVNVSLMLLWFVVPLFFIFVFFIIKSVFKRISIKRDFNKAKNKEKEKAEKTEKNHEIIDVPIEEIEEVLVEPVNRFLDYPITKIRYKSILGLQRAYEVSKEKGLIVDTTDTGYVAVFSSEDGMKVLKALLSAYGISISKVSKEPSVVLFDESEVESISIKHELERLNQQRREKRA